MANQTAQSPFVLQCPSCQRQVGVLAASVLGWCTCHNGRSLRTHAMRPVS
jgi:hypothetical protein